MGLTKAPAMSGNSLPPDLHPRQSPLRGMLVVIGLAALTFGAMWWLHSTP